LAAYIAKEKKPPQAPGCAPHIKVASRAKQPEPILAALLDPLSWLGDPLDQLRVPIRSRLQRTRGVPVPPAQSRTASIPATSPLAAGEGCSLLPVPTHLPRGAHDPSPSLVAVYARRLRPGDILTTVKQPLAVMQAVLQHPAHGRCPPPGPGCSAAPSQSTQQPGTACGLQTLIDDVRSSQCSVPRAWRAGAEDFWVAKVGSTRLPGAGPLIDVSSRHQRPPTTQTIVLGPQPAPNKPCRQTRPPPSRGAPVAWFDVNDLGRSRVLASE